MGEVTQLVCRRCGNKTFFYKPDLSSWEKGHRAYKCESCGSISEIQEKMEYDKAIYVYLEEGDEVV